MDSHLRNCEVAIASGEAVYPAEPPFHPGERYPEAPSDETGPANGVYAMVRDALRLLGMDPERYGTPEWNPLGEIVRPGDRVLLKPNFVLHLNAGGGPLEAVVTHPSVLRAVADYVLVALGGSGQLVIGDSPQMNCNFVALGRATGLDGLVEYLDAACARRGVGFRFVDFRDEQAIYWRGIVWERRSLEGGERAVRVELGRESSMEGIDNRRLYGADYDRRVTVQAHSGRHEYVVSSEVLDADVVISVPKLKVHRKVGTTLNLKNMVGINVDKNHLAHYRVGSPAEGGDEVANPGWDDRVERYLSDTLLGTNWRVGKYPFLGWKAVRKAYRSMRRSPSNLTVGYGNWHGNDTAWRMALDLNRVLLCAGSDGRMSDEPVRRYFSVLDGVIGGEGEGPLHPDPYPSGVVLAGWNPVAVDWIATRLMGLDPERIPLYRNAIEQMRDWMPDFDVAQFRAATDVPAWRDIAHDDTIAFTFRPSAGWVGTVER